MYGRGLSFRVGLLIVGGIALLIGLVVFLSGNQFSEGVPFESYFKESVQGLEVGAAVKFRGVTLGRVTKIGLVSAEYGRNEPPDVRSASGASVHDSEGNWQQALDRELAQALARGERSVADRLEKEFERTLIVRALAHTGGHRMEAAQWLGWGRNTLTRKIQELKLDVDKH